MRNFDELYRSLIRRTRLNSHKSSSPFLSGDTFRSICDYKFDSVSDLSNIGVLRRASGRVFVSTGTAGEFFDKLVPDISAYLNLTLFIHNGDDIIDSEKLKFWAGEFSLIYCVNHLQNIPGVLPIPIGLENWSLMRNGVPSDYLKQVSSHRDIKLLVAFKDENNYPERSSARREATKVSGVHICDSLISPKEYRDLVSRSEFVLSPPGNGPDCHRTWEALYLGAIPIVKRNSWPFAHLAIPVLILEDWSHISDDVLNFSKIIGEFCGTKWEEQFWELINL